MIKPVPNRCHCQVYRFKVLQVVVLLNCLTEVESTITIINLPKHFPPSWLERLLNTGWSGNSTTRSKSLECCIHSYLAQSSDRQWGNVLYISGRQDAFHRILLELSEIILAQLQTKKKMRLIPLTALQWFWLWHQDQVGFTTASIPPKGTKGAVLDQNSLNDVLSNCPLYMAEGADSNWTEVAIISAWLDQIECCISFWRKLDQPSYRRYCV